MSPHQRLPVQLPEIGILIGTGIMNSKLGYLVGSGMTHTTWVPQLFSPSELLDKIIEDNQGNFVQYWGFSGGLGPVTFARHYALEDIGMIPPEPDWENKKNLVIADWVNKEDFRERNGAGVLKLIQKARDKGLYIGLIYTEAHPNWSKQFIPEGGKYYVGYDFGERFSFGLDEIHLKEGTLQTITLQTLADDLVRRVKEEVDKRHELGWGNVAATSASFHIDYEIAGGADIPMCEDFAFQNLNLASALSRGLMRQYNLPVWGSHLAHEHYSWVPYAFEHKFDILTAAFFQKYMAGSKIIVNESGGWYQEAQLGTDYPMFETPRVPGDCNKRDPYLAAEYYHEAVKTFDKINYHSPVSREYRRRISEFYNFVKEHGTPKGQPEATIAIIKGNLDLGSERHWDNAAVAGMYSLAEKDPHWYSGQPERSWNILRKVFFPLPDIYAPWQNLHLSGTPYGQVDVVSFACDNVDADFLSANYRALIFGGWNTASEKQYRELCRYVARGGTLFVSLPHLSTNKTRNYADFRLEELVRCGDLSELCGVRVKSKGKRFYWATPSPDHNGELGSRFPRRFGIMRTCVADIDITDPENVEVLAADDEQFFPVLLRRRLGNGTVYYLNTWAYPGATDQDFGPGAPIGSPGLAGYIFHHIARTHRGTVWITDDTQNTGPECTYINYSYFPEDGSICLLNIDFRHPHRVFVHHHGKVEEVTLAPKEFRFLVAPPKPPKTR